MARVFDIRQPHAAYQQLICANGRRRVVAESAGGGDEVVLINAVAADADCAHQNAVFVECGAAREDLKAVRQEWSVRKRRTIRHHSDRKSTRLNSSHLGISYAVFCLKKKIHNRS